MNLGLLSIAIVFAASSAMAQHGHQSNAPAETGQSQFAAIAEIVTMLRDEPETDWANVDIKALRDHLVDMDNVTTKASVQQEKNGLSVIFSITGDALVATSVQRMVLAHSPMLQASTNWKVLSEKIEHGATMMVRVSSEDEMKQILGLGFFGLMTIGAHHQQHHLMIATGRSPH
ncbi:hypothetical protein [Litoreibacter janthinus]|uniref:Uncharacterized protein n=1 Tax=Litoreibacter janthinus TaxID=670154 RepID=A0A1I6GAI7_9RHOB|nr:hypothetical protein [Litoreibacter janthinus]SFR39226.1 hypothetical protein SAMN04488002_1154 [Litoreibacter janthinus]